VARAGAKRTLMDQIVSADTMTAAIRDANNYHDWVFASFARFLQPGSTLEIGSGHGQYSRRMAPLVRDLIVSDIDPAAIERIRIELASIANVRYLVMDGLDPERLRQTVDNIVLINVLEHIEDDAHALRQCRDNLADGGSVIVFSPAFPLLFSRMDEAAGHFRRYTRSGLIALVRAAGFDVRHIRYVNAVGFFGWLVNKWMGSDINSSTTNLQVQAYDRLIPLIRHVDRVAPFIGQSLLVVATKRSGDAVGRHPGV
jgi:SAM-dependent methyltransferase